jgi:DNA-binding CsgD family transcriptional regulator
MMSASSSSDLMPRYMSQDYAKIDPVVRRGLLRTAPLDWDETPKDSNVIKVMFGEAREHGVGERGLTIPIRGAHGEIALFSVNADLSLEEWSKFKRHYVRDFQVIGHHFHEHVLKRENVIAHEIRLTPHQREILKWIADGKTDWETGEILHVSEHTVRYHMEGIKAKFGATNRVQALVRAARLHIV